MNKKENTKKKVFAVSSGAGDDYCIEAMFSTKEDALAYLDWKDDSYQLEEWELDEPYERKPHFYDVFVDMETRRKIQATIMTVVLPEFKDTIRYTGKNSLRFRIESDSKSRAIEEAKERLDYVIQNEQTKFPYLRVNGVKFCNGVEMTASFDYNTGELVMVDNPDISVILPDFVKVRKIKRIT